MRTGLFALLSLVVISCLVDDKEERLVIKGQWLAVRPSASYIALDFADTTAVFDNRGDTINRFTYTIDQVKRKLVLTDPFGKKKTAAILKLDKDSVVFNRLWDLNTVQRFYKRNK